MAQRNAILTPFTASSGGTSGTGIEIKFTAINNDSWDEVNDGDSAFPPAPPGGNPNFIAWNPNGAASTGGKIYTLDGNTLTQRDFEIRVEDTANANIYVEFDPTELAANFDKFVILDAVAPAFPPGQPIAASGGNAN